MLTVLYGESADLLRHLVGFYAPRAPELLDITYGAGTLSKRLPIPVVGVDKDPTSKAAVIADFAALPFEDAQFALACFDPPYLYGSHAMHMGPVGQKTWQSQRTTLKRPEDMEALCAAAAKGLWRVCCGGSTVVVKIMDSRWKGRLIRNHDLAIAAFEQAGWLLFDVLVYIRTVIGSFTNTRSAQNAHGYYLVFRKPQ